MLVSELVRLLLISAASALARQTSAIAGQFAAHRDDGIKRDSGREQPYALFFCIPEDAILDDEKRRRPGGRGDRTENKIEN